MGVFSLVIIFERAEIFITYDDPPCVPYLTPTYKSFIIFEEGLEGNRARGRQ
jgi:hypothetical protein